jgi:hypothetical protein
MRMVRKHDKYKALTVWTASDSYFEVEVCILDRRVVGTVGWGIHCRHSGVLQEEEGVERGRGTEWERVEGVIWLRKIVEWWRSKMEWVDMIRYDDRGSWKEELGCLWEGEYGCYKLREK